MKTFALLLSLSLASVLANDSQAQPPKGPPPGAQMRMDGWRFNVGLASIYNPLFEGDDQHGFSIVPDIRIYHGREFFFSVGEGVGYKWTVSENLEVGPIGRYKFTRRQNQSPNPFQVSGRTNDLNGMGDVPGSFEIGGFAVFKLTPLEFRLEGRKGTGGHKGEILQISGSYGHRWGPILGRIGPNAEFGSHQYIDRYFGISPEQSLGTGFSEYEAPGGLKSIGISALVLAPFFYPYAFAVIANLKQLQSPVSDSPLIQQKGRPEQWFLGVSASYQL